MANAYYTCNLVPFGLLVRAGYSPRWLGGHLREIGAPARRDALAIHPMTCPYVTQLVAAADELLAESPNEDCLVVPGGCDAMRRMGDLLATAFPGRVFCFSLPRSSGATEIRTLSADLRRLEDWLRVRLSAGREPGAPAGRALPPTVDVSAEPPSVNYTPADSPGGVFIVAGPLSDNSLLQLLQGLGAEIAGLESCTSPDRWRPLADLTHLPAACESPATDNTIPQIAAQMLAIGMCPRRSTVQRREYLAHRLDEASPSAVIYARQSFCDPGAYDALTVAQLADERGLPYLEIEVGFPFDAGGPLRTRVEAFLESQMIDDALLDDLDDDLLDDDPRDDLRDDLGDPSDLAEFDLADDNDPTAGRRILGEGPSGDGRPAERITGSPALRRTSSECLEWPM